MFNYNETEEEKELRIKKTIQNRLNEKDIWLASYYGDKLTFNEVIALKRCALTEVLIKYNVKTIMDVPWGKGYLEYYSKWEEKMKEVIKNREVIKNGN